MKTCPLCRESVLEPAIICKHCHKDIPAVPAPEWRSASSIGPFRWGMSRDEVIALIEGERQEFPTGSIGFYCAGLFDTPVTWTVNVDILDDRLVGIFGVTPYSAGNFTPLTLHVVDALTSRFGRNIEDSLNYSIWQAEETVVKMTVGGGGLTLLTESAPHAAYFHAWQNAERKREAALRQGPA